MSSSPAKIIILAGAPISSSLEWDEAYLSASIAPNFADFSIPKTHRYLEPRLSARETSWRSLQLQHQYLRSGLSQPVLPAQYIHDPGTGNLSFLSTSSLSSTSLIEPPSHSPTVTSEEDDALTLFYDHSVTLLESSAPPSSPPPDHPKTDAEANGEVIHVHKPEQEKEVSSVSTTTTTASFINTSAPTQSTFIPTPPIPPQDLILTPIDQLPTPSHLHALIPQTPTYNLLVGLITILPPRTVLTRTTPPRCMSLTELLVGDETRAGFPITFWLPSLEEIAGKPGKAELPAILRSRLMLDSIRRQDLLLLRNVALSTYQGRIYGQSLRRGLTNIHIVHRKGRTASVLFTDHDLANAVHPADQLKTRARRVRSWVMDFVGPVTHLDSGRTAAAQTEDEILPTDTQ